MSYEREPIEATVAQLRPGMKSVNITFKVVAKGEAREVTSRSDGATHRILDATAGDSTGVVTLSLWDDTIDAVEVDKTYRLENGYTNTYQGYLRLNIGRYGTLSEAEKPIEEVDTENDMSATQHERYAPRRSYGAPRYPRYGSDSYGRSSRRRRR